MTRFIIPYYKLPKLWATCLGIWLLMLCNVANAQNPATKPKKINEIYPVVDKWADSIVSNMSLDEKIGQLFMVSGYGTKDKINMDELKKLVTKYHVGGIIWFKGTPYKTAQMTNQLQNLTNYPLLISIDAEWGLAMRLDSTINFGYQMPIGAIRDDSMAYYVGQAIALQCKRMGIHINFAPVADINNNPKNPVINLRSYGENKYAVAHKSYMYAAGMQDVHVLACAKHFPGHGNTFVDSHFELPTLKWSKSELDTLELYPFKYLFNRGIGSVMTAHLNVPAYDTSSHVGASLSPYMTSLLLRDKMSFRGLAITDALNMQGVAKYFPPGELELLALQAGNDILLCSDNVPTGIKRIKQAIESGCLSMEFLDERVRRIVQAKKWTGAWGCQQIDLNNITEDLNNVPDMLLKQEVADKAVTIVLNERKLLPLKSLDNIKVAAVAFGTKLEQPFQKMLRNYNRHDFFMMNMYSTDAEYKKLLDTLKYYDVVIISLHRLSNKNTYNYGMGINTLNCIKQISKRKQTIVANFGSPYLSDSLRGADALICGYQDEYSFQQAAAQMIYGGIPSAAKLPVTAGIELNIGVGYVNEPAIRMPYVEPEATGMDSKVLAGITKLVNEAINAKAIPGCQIVVAHKGKIVYQKSFGYQTYSKLDKVKNSDLYDIASITKVASTTLIAMKLYEKGKLNIFATLEQYLPELKGTNKAKIQIKELMTHQAGLVDYIPFYKNTLDSNHCPSKNLYCFEKNDRFSLQVTDNLYLDNYYKDTIYKIMDKSVLKNRGSYKYSDLSMLYMQRVIERITGKTLNQLADSLYYKPLGLASLGYLPLTRFQPKDICPTENDSYFRYKLIQGYVHDPTAAMLGGVAGHAGVFSNANDLAILMQMLLNGGKYGVTKYLDTTTVQLFTAKQYNKNRRGLGWDKPPTVKGEASPAGKLASIKTYGHTGFTGTCVWVDPANDLVYVFLSNRVYPSAEDNILAKMNTRTEIHDIIYKSIIKK
ncbi:MAG: glycoside hydrolase family 3 N-terminal domain-containing protein [Bacteroidota bacterium]|nr:glycoside hydrolase family 3 N-terminal domain-containing protein [Bacteroidota bacterium]